MSNNDAGDAVFRVALEDYASRMSNEDFQAFTTRVRPASATGQGAAAVDPAERQRGVLASIARKQANRPPVNVNGYPINEEAAK